jgi:hypothetical protein
MRNRVGVLDFRSVGVFDFPNVHVDSGGPDLHAAERLAGIAKHQRDPAECLCMKSALAQSIDQPLGEREFIVATLDVQEYRRAPGSTLQLTEPGDEGRFSHAARSGQPKTCAIGQFPLKPGEVAGAVKKSLLSTGEPVMFRMGRISMPRSCL